MQWDNQCSYIWAGWVWDTTHSSQAFIKVLVILEEYVEYTSIKKIWKTIKCNKCDMETTRILSNYAQNPSRTLGLEAQN